MRTLLVAVLLCLLVGRAAATCDSNSYLTETNADEPSIWLRFGEATVGDGQSCSDYGSAGLTCTYRNSAVTTTGALTSTTNAAVDFSGSNACAELSSYNWPTGSYTIAFWANKVSESAADYVLDHNNGPAILFEYLEDSFELHNAIQSCRDASALTLVGTGSWHFYVYVWNDGTDTLTTYKDGSLVASTGSVDCNGSGSGAIYDVGGGTCTAGESVDHASVKIDELAIYFGKALSSTRVAALWTAGTCTVGTPTVTPTLTAAPTPTFTPAAGSPPVAGYEVWLKSSLGVTLVNGFVSQWADQSGNNHNATQSSSSKRPYVTDNALGSHPGIVFDGVDSYMVIPSLALDSHSTWFAVAKQELGTSPGVLLLVHGLGNSSTNGAYLRGDGYSHFVRRVPNSHYTVVSEDTFGVSSWHAVGARYNDTFRVVRDSSVIDASNTVGSVVGDSSFSATLCIGCFIIDGVAQTFSNMTILEFIVYNSALSDSDMTDVMAYLDDNYGLPLATTPTLTRTATITPTQTSTQTPTQTPTQTSTQTPTQTPTQTSTQTPTQTPTQTTTQTPTFTPTEEGALTPTQTNTFTITPTNAARATVTASPIPAAEHSIMQLTGSTINGTAYHGQSTSESTAVRAKWHLGIDFQIQCLAVALEANVASGSLTFTIQKQNNTGSEPATFADTDLTVTFSAGDRKKSICSAVSVTGGTSGDAIVLKSVAATTYSFKAELNLTDSSGNPFDAVIGWSKALASVDPGSTGMGATDGESTPSHGTMVIPRSGYVSSYCVETESDSDKTWSLYNVTTGRAISSITLDSSTHECNSTCTSADCYLEAGDLIGYRFDGTGSATGRWNMTSTINGVGGILARRADANALTDPMYFSVGTSSSTSTTQIFTATEEHVIDRLCAQSALATIDSSYTIVFCSGSSIPPDCTGPRPTVILPANDTSVYCDAAHPFSVKIGEYYYFKGSGASGGGLDRIGVSLEFVAPPTPTVTPTASAVPPTATHTATRTPTVAATSTPPATQTPIPNSCCQCLVGVLTCSAPAYGASCTGLYCSVYQNAVCTESGACVNFTFTPTRTPTGAAPATPTRTPNVCCGDKDGSGSVTNEEVAYCYYIALGTLSLSSNTSCDCNADGSVSGSEYQAAYTHYLSQDCASPATPTITRTRTRTQTPTRTPTQPTPTRTTTPTSMAHSIAGKWKVTWATNPACGINGEPFFKLASSTFRVRPLDATHIAISTTHAEILAPATPLSATNPTPKAASLVAVDADTLGTNTVYYYPFSKNLCAGVRRQFKFPYNFAFTPALNTGTVNVTWDYGLNTPTCVQCSPATSMEAHGELRRISTIP